MAKLSGKYLIRIWKDGKLNFALKYSRSLGIGQWCNVDITKYYKYADCNLLYSVIV